MSLERITKEEFDSLYRDAVDNVEDSLYDELNKEPLDKDLIREYTNNYLFLLDFRKDYIALKHDYHIVHYLNGNSITYTKNGKIIKGFGFRKK